MSKQIETANHKKVCVDLDSFDRIRRHSPEHINRRIERDIQRNVEQYGAGGDRAMTSRIDALDREWDIDRATMVFFATVGGIALTLGLTKDRRWLRLLGIQLPFLAYHAATGWCPPVALLRRFGLRSFKEIDAEKYALKSLRGDFAMH